jgi:hypothetical protein
MGGSINPNQHDPIVAYRVNRYRTGLGDRERPLDRATGLRSQSSETWRVKERQQQKDEPQGRHPEFSEKHRFHSSGTSG